ncbi:hypothetical protein Bca4012_051456 [Brassica carinata]
MSSVSCQLRHWFVNLVEIISRFNKSHNGITACINAMMYSLLRKGYKTYSVMPSEEKEIWFRNFAVIF